MLGTTVHLTAGGTCTITASQPGNASFANAPDVPRTFSIAKVAQTIAFGALPARSFGEPDFAVGAIASSGLPVSFATAGSCTVAGSTVHLTAHRLVHGDRLSAGQLELRRRRRRGADVLDRKGRTRRSRSARSRRRRSATQTLQSSATTSSGLAVSLAAAGNCTLSGATAHITGAGSCTITASQAGDANFNAAADVAQSFAIAKASQTITFAALPNKTFGAAKFAAHAKASSGLAVSFAASGSCSVSGTTVHLKSAGTCTLTASQPGNANYNAANSVARAFKVLQPPCSVPRVVGKKLAAAKTSIKKKHCRTGKVGFAYSTKIAKGRVVSQNRRAGRVLAPGAKINLVVSRGRRP